MIREVEKRPQSSNERIKKRSQNSIKKIEKKYLKRDSSSSLCLVGKLQFFRGHFVVFALGLLRLTSLMHFCFIFWLKVVKAIKA